MSDETTVQASEIEPTPAPARGGSGAPAFLSSGTGRVVMIGAAVAVVVVIAAVAVFMFLGAFGQGTDGTGTTPGAGALPGVVATGSVSPSASVEASEAPDRTTLDTATDEDVFVPRDPFHVLFIATDEKTTEHIVQNALTLEAIFWEDSRYKAVVTSGGKRYTVAMGDKVAAAQWFVTEITRSTMTVAVGDTFVTLGVGQGVTTTVGDDGSGGTGSASSSK